MSEAHEGASGHGDKVTRGCEPRCSGGIEVGTALRAVLEASNAAMSVRSPDPTSRQFEKGNRGPGTGKLANGQRPRHNPLSPCHLVHVSPIEQRQLGWHAVPTLPDTGQPYPMQSERGAKRGTGKLVGGRSPQHKPLSPCHLVNVSPLQQRQLGWHAVPTLPRDRSNPTSRQCGPYLLQTPKISFRRLRR